MIGCAAGRNGETTIAGSVRARGGQTEADWNPDSVWSESSAGKPHMGPWCLISR
jgi:hypothetical protein